MWSIIALAGHLPLYAAGRLDCVNGAATQRVNGKRGLRVAHSDGTATNDNVTEDIDLICAVGHHEGSYYVSKCLEFSALVHLGNGA